MKVFDYNVDADEYRNIDGSKVLREQGTPTSNGLTLSGEWVLRGAEGAFIDFHQYRTDLESRNYILLRDTPRTIPRV